VRAEGDRLVVFDLDTPGGMVTSTLDICDEIKKLRADGIRTCAWVNDKAYSGGTVVALATDEIVMAPNATIGDSQMIVVTSSGVGAVPEEIQAKMKSPLLAELRDSARRNGYSMDAVLAFVEPERELFWIENSRTGERRLVGPRERDQLFGIEADGRSSPESGAANDKGRPSEPLPAPRSDSDWRYVKSAPGLGAVHQPIDGPNELLTLRTPEARAYGFATATIGSESELRDYLHIRGSIQRLDTTWVESAVEWLASPGVRGVLFLLMLLGAYAEFKAPGSVLPGSVALIALVLFLGAPYAAGFTVTWEIIAIVAGIVLLALEAFVIPGFGLPGIAGILLLAVGLIASFVPREVPIPGSGSSWWPTMPLQFDYLKRGLWALAGGLTGSLMGMALLARYFPKVPVAGRLVLPNPTREQVTVDDPYEGLARVGHIGRTEGPLRPAGKARFGALLVDVVSDGEFVPPGTRVEVVERAGSRVVVRRVD
jgi:membrane-bound serine protease (ClpP class)